MTSLSIFFIQDRPNDKKKEGGNPFSWYFRFGGSEGRKFTTRRFKTMISEIYTLPIKDQGDKVSIDDILVIGVKMEGE